MNDAALENMSTAELVGQAMDEAKGLVREEAALVREEAIDRKSVV